MVIRGRAPLRVSFGGGGTDVAPFCEEQGGAIIGSTINKYAYCSIVPREDDQIIVHSLDFDMTVKYNTKENYVYDGRLDLVTAALKAMERGIFTVRRASWLRPWNLLYCDGSHAYGYGKMEGDHDGRLCHGGSGLSGGAAGFKD